MEKDPEAIRHDIEQTRERLGDTVEALAYKADVPARAKDSVNDQVDSAKETVLNVVDSAKSTLGDVAQSAQAKVADVAQSARPQIENLRDTVSSATAAARGAVSDASRNLPTPDDVGSVAANAKGRLGDRSLVLTVGGVILGIFLLSLFIFRQRNTDIEPADAEIPYSVVPADQTPSNKM